MDERVMDMEQSEELAAAERSRMDRKSRFAAFGTAFVSKGFTMYPVILLMFLIGAFFAPRFLTAVNLINIAAQDRGVGGRVGLSPKLLRPRKAAIHGHIITEHEGIIPSPA